MIQLLVVLSAAALASLPTVMMTTGIDPVANLIFHLTTPLPDGVSAFLCNFLDNHGVKLVKVLKKAGLCHDTPADWQTSDMVHALYMASQ